MAKPVQCLGVTQVHMSEDRLSWSTRDFSSRTGIRSVKLESLYCIHARPQNVASRIISSVMHILYSDGGRKLFYGIPHYKFI